MINYTIEMELPQTPRQIKQLHLQLSGHLGTDKTQPQKSTAHPGCSEGHHNFSQKCVKTCPTPVQLSQSYIQTDSLLNVSIFHFSTHRSWLMVSELELLWVLVIFCGWFPDPGGHWALAEGSTKAEQFHHSITSRAKCITQLPVTVQKIF